MRNERRTWLLENFAAGIGPTPRLCTTCMCLRLCMWMRAFRTFSALAGPDQLKSQAGQTDFEKMCGSSPTDVMITLILAIGMVVTVGIMLVYTVLQRFLISGSDFGRNCVCHEKLFVCAEAA
jgi:ABC-type glycerol-3-phosphate transport system permease component